MRLLLKLFFAALITIASALPTFAAETRVVPANRASVILFYYTAMEDTCYSGARPKVHITRKPEHGTITTAWKAHKMGKESGKCAGKPMRGTLVVYHPAPGYRGTDKVKIIFGGGEMSGYFLRPKEWIIDIVVK